MSDNESHGRFFFPSKLVFIDAASLTARLTGEYERRREKKKGCKLGFLLPDDFVISTLELRVLDLLRCSHSFFFLLSSSLFIP